MKLFIKCFELGRNISSLTNSDHTSVVIMYKWAFSIKTYKSVTQDDKKDDYNIEF